MLSRKADVRSRSENKPRDADRDLSYWLDHGGSTLAADSYHKCCGAVFRRTMNTQICLARSLVWIRVHLTITYS